MNKRYDQNRSCASDKDIRATDDFDDEIDDDLDDDLKEDDSGEDDADEHARSANDEGHSITVPLVPWGGMQTCNVPTNPFPFPALVPFPQPWRNPIPPPLDTCDVYRRSAARLFALNCLEEVAARIVPHGHRVGSEYRAVNLLVALDHLVDPWFGMQLTPGAWVYNTGLCGFDLLELFAQVHGVSYSKSAETIFDANRDQCENGSSQIRKLPHWTQDLQPLHYQSYYHPVFCFTMTPVPQFAGLRRSPLQQVYQSLRRVQHMPVLSET